MVRHENEKEDAYFGSPSKPRQEEVHRQQFEIANLITALHKLLWRKVPQWISPLNGYCLRYTPRSQENKVGPSYVIRPAGWRRGSDIKFYPTTLTRVYKIVVCPEPDSLLRLVNLYGSLSNAGDKTGVRFEVRGTEFSGKTGEQAVANRFTCLIFHGFTYHDGNKHLFGSMCF